MLEVERVAMQYPEVKAELDLDKEYEEDLKKEATDPILDLP